MFLRDKFYMAMAMAVMSLPAAAQQTSTGTAATDGNQIVVNVVKFFGSLGYGILALMVLIGLWCLYVFGTSLMKMGDENQRDQVKPKTLVTSLAGALVLTYGSYVLFVAMNTAFGGAPDETTSSAFSAPAST